MLYFESCKYVVYGGVSVKTPSFVNVTYCLVFQLYKGNANIKNTPTLHFAFEFLLQVIFQFVLAHQKQLRKTVS